LPIIGSAHTITSIGAPEASFNYEEDNSDVTVGEEQVSVGVFTSKTHPLLQKLLALPL